MRRQHRTSLPMAGMATAIALVAIALAVHVRNSRTTAEGTATAQVSSDQRLVIRNEAGRRTAVLLEAKVHRHGKGQACQSCAGVHRGVDSAHCQGCGELRWSSMREIPWEEFGQGEYVGPPRTRYIPQYRLRVDDLLEFVYYFTNEASDQAYRLGVGDTLVIESLTDETLNRGDLVQGTGLEIQPDGTITVLLLNQVPAAGRTVAELREELEQRYLQFYNNPVITVTPLRTNAKLDALRSAIDSRFGAGGQVRQARVTPEGTIQLPGIPSTPAHGLTIEELQREIEERYRESFGPGVNATASLVQAAPTYAYVIGEVFNPGQIQLAKPTTALQAISMAGGWVNGANLREIVVLRRAQDWRLMATKLDLRGALMGERPIPSDEIWLRDSDVIIVPQNDIRRLDDFINLVFTRGIYGVVPFGGINIGFAKASTI